MANKHFSSWHYFNKQVDSRAEFTGHKKKMILNRYRVMKAVELIKQIKIEYINALRIETHSFKSHRVSLEGFLGCQCFNNILFSSTF